LLVNQAKANNSNMRTVVIHIFLSEKLIILVADFVRQFGIN